MSDKEKKPKRKIEHQLSEQERGFLTAILAHPKSVIPKIAYAQWLREHGDQNIATLIFLKTGAEYADKHLTPEQRATLQPIMSATREKLENAFAAVLHVDGMEVSKYLNIYNLLKGEPFFTITGSSKESKDERAVYTRIAENCGPDVGVSVAMMTRDSCEKLDLLQPYTFAIQHLDKTSFDIGLKLDIANTIADKAQEEGWQQLYKLANVEAVEYRHEMMGSEAPRKGKGR